MCVWSMDSVLDSTDNGRPRTCGDKLDSGSSSAGNGTNLQAKGSMALELLIAINLIVSNQSRLDEERSKLNIHARPRTRRRCTSRSINVLELR